MTVAPPPTPAEGQPRQTELDRPVTSTDLPPGQVLRALEASSIQRIVSALADGRVVAFPTDTVYALAGSIDHHATLARIFAVKARPLTKPLPLLLSGVDVLSRVAVEPRPALLELLEQHWPGPLTVVLPAQANLPSAVLAPDGTVAVRIPAHSVALDVIRGVGGVLAATSANRSADPPAVDAQGVRDAFDDTIDLILDGGRTPGTVASTVVRISNGSVSVLREGPIGADALQLEPRTVASLPGRR